MTDLPTPGMMAVPARLGVTARIVEGSLVIDVVPQDHTLRHGVLRASVVSFAVDAVAGILVDDDPEVWTFTTDLSVRMRPVPAPARVRAVERPLRRGRRSVTSAVEVTDESGASVATGTIGFARVPRKPTDPPKLGMTPELAAEAMADLPTLDAPLRDAAGIEVLDAAEGVVEVAVTPALTNPAGTLQGAMVALLAEVAAEDLVAARFGIPAVVVDLDLRYLAQARVGPVRTRSRLLGDGPGDPIEVELVDTSTDVVTTVAYARAVAVG